jgi:hypothetical protein
LTVADGIADLARAAGGDGGGLGPGRVDVHPSDDIAELFRCTAAKRHHQIDAKQP